MAETETHLPMSDSAADAPTGGFAEGRLQQIAEAAYFLAEARGFAPGRELEDWLAAEREIDARLADLAYRR